MRTFSYGISAILVLLLCAASADRAMAQMFTYERNNPGILYEVSTANGTLTMIGSAALAPSPDIEYANGVVYTCTDNLNSINPATGALVDSIDLIFPAEGNVVTAMEYIDGTLYGGLATRSSPNLPSYLVTIGVTTGVITVIGKTGIDDPLGGLAWNGRTLYAVSAGNNNSTLYTINRTTGAATAIAAVTFSGNGFGATALEFDTGGKLYTCPNVTDVYDGLLLTIDPTTAATTQVGDTGSDIFALTSDWTPPPATAGTLNLLLEE